MRYTLDQLRQARQNALNAGDTAAAEELLRYAVRQAAAESPSEAIDPTEGMSWHEKLRAGVGQGMVNVVRHGGNLIGVVDDDALQAAKERDADLLRTGWGRTGAILGETAALAVPMAGATGALVKGSTTAAHLLANPVTRGALEGAAQGAIMSDPGARGEGAVLGGAFGAAIPAALKVGGKAVHGLRRTPEAQALLDRGVDLTPGQLNPGGMLNKLEEDIASVPVANRFITPVREQARRQWQQTVLREGAAPGAQIPTADVDEMLEAAYRSFEPLYARAKGFPVRPVVMRTAGGDQPLGRLFEQATKAGSVRATDATRKSTLKWLRNQLTQFDGSSEGLLAMRSKIRTESRAARLLGDADDRAAAQLLDNAESAVTHALESQLPDEALQALRLADSKYGTYKVIENAVAAAKDAPGGFTPSQLSNAVKQATETGAYARGAGGPLRELASQGRQTFDVRSPLTGQRVATYMAGGAGLYANPQVALPAAGAFIGMVGTRTGRRLAAGTTSAQRRLAEALRRVDRLPQPTRNVSERYARAALASQTNE